MTEKITAKDIVDALTSLHLDKICVVELDLAPGTRDNRRVDFWTLEVAASKLFRTVGYEIKVSRQDYRRDSEEKQRQALSISDRFFYVAPKGMLGKEEIPSWAGLMEFDGHVFNVAKRAPKLPAKEDPTWLLVVSIMRNSVAVRRDVSLIREMQFFAERQAETARKQLEAAERRQWQKWERRIAARSKGGAA